MNKKLYKSNNRIISGVCGGIGEFFGIDPTLVRICWAIAVFIGGTGLILYIICACIMPVYPGPGAGNNPPPENQNYPEN